MKSLKEKDPQIYAALKKEFDRQRDGFELIPSENYVSREVLLALGSIGTNKYSEGMVNKRYYGGNQFIDELESVAVSRAKKLFGVDHVNVQPYSGSPANQAVYFALLKPGDKVMGLNLLFGGHLTHGWNVNFSGSIYSAVHYRTGRDALIDYDEVERLARKEQPGLIFCGATAYPRIYDYKRLGEIAHSIDSYFAADIAHEAGLVASKVIHSPVGHADVITTTTHKTLRGPRGGMVMCNGLPSEPLRPLPKDADRRKNLPTLIDRAIFPGLQGGPHNHTTAAIGVALGEAMQPGFRTYCRQILRNAKALADGLTERGYRLVTGGTDNHLMVVDLTGTGVFGKEAETALDRAGITCNKNTIPWDTRKPYDPSGIRLGTPAVTTRGFKAAQMEDAARLIDRVLKNPHKGHVLEACKDEVMEICREFPIYDDLDYP